MEFALVTNILFGTCLLFCFGVNNAERNPTISHISPKIVTMVGETIEMDCRVLHATVYPILWVKLPRECPQDRDNLKPKVTRGVVLDKCIGTPLSSGSALIIRDNRFSLRYDTASSTYTLQIKDVSRSDEATYQCQIHVDINDKVTRNVSLIVNQPATISDDFTSSVAILENSSVELECQALGVPVPTVYWRRGGNAILPNGDILLRGNILRMHNVRKEDRGTYYCMAENGIGQPARKDVAVEVEFAPDIQGGGGQVAQVLGQSVELICHAEGYPRPVLTWIHQGSHITTNQVYDVENVLLATGDLSESTIRVKNLGPRQLGVYSCRAQNKLGRVEKEFLITEAFESKCVVGQCDEFVSSGSSYLLQKGFAILLTTLLTALSLNLNH